MHIRDAHEDEFDEIGEIRVGAYLADGFLSADSGYAPHLRELGADGSGHVLVAVGADGKLIGTVMLLPWPEGGNLTRAPCEAEIRALAVRPEARGAGIGRAPVAPAVDMASRHGVRDVLLLTQSEIEVA